ncbi:MULTISPECIES: hypothetical protein [Agrobacterium]|uniref:hypothetical protein n=1 Tax=Agrobacterium TaxID=357 RepID=UPI0023004DA9|nr:MULTISPECIES: hypothetical protein [Agrobacterium]MDA5641493.1 hypothetical protein [Agrobacterium sp. ST15.13.013]MDA7001694.1 hypothetical protein [Agrobacterium salinitolerans]
MAIIAPSNSEVVRETFIEGLANMIENDEGVGGDFVSAPITGDAPLPVYTLNAQAAATMDLTQPPGGWRYLFSLGGVPMFADIVIESQDQLRFNSLTEGRAAEAFIEAFGWVQDFADTEADQFMLRIVEVPAINEVAVWLHGQKDDWIFEVLRRGKQATNRPVRVFDYLSELSADIEHSYIFSGRPTPSDHNGNDHDI